MLKQKKNVQPVQKPILTGSWHGADAWLKGLRMMLSVLLVSVLYVLFSLLMNFDSLALRCIVGVILVGVATTYLYYSGASAGQADAGFAEIMYQRNQEGKEIPKADRDHCFHPAKGFFEVLIGTAPFFLLALIFACITQPIQYTLGVLPAWIQPLTRQSEFGAALAYYSEPTVVTLETVLRVIVRAMTMPFINVSLGMGDAAVLLAERLAPLWVLIAPLGYGFGYRQGVRLRTRINTGIALGDQKKRRRERRERQARAKSHESKQLI